MATWRSWDPKNGITITNGEVRIDLISVDGDRLGFKVWTADNSFLFPVEERKTALSVNISAEKAMETSKKLLNLFTDCYEDGMSLRSLADEMSYVGGV